MRYKAWGEVRYASGDPHTDKSYTGQRSYTDDFGLMFYNARWYDTTTGRFAQADTIIPSGVQGYDRYAYTSNNPVNRTDPSGHYSCNSAHDSAKTACGDSKKTIEEKLADFGITLAGNDMRNWTDARKVAVLQAARLVGAAFAYLGETAANAFKEVYGKVKITWGQGPNDGHEGGCDEITTGGCTTGAHNIYFQGMSGNLQNDITRMTKNVVHEFGHAFDNSMGYYQDLSDGSKTFRRPSNLTTPYNSVNFVTNRNIFLRSNDPDGFIDWQQHPLNMDALGPTSGEAFGDMFLAWTYNSWNTNPANSGDVFKAKQYMNYWTWAARP